MSDSEERQERTYSTYDHDPNVKRVIKHRFDYVCDLCNKTFHLKSHIVRHLNSKRICYEKRGLTTLNSMLKENIISIPDYIDKFLIDVNIFENQCNQDTKYSLDELIIIKDNLIRMKLRFNKMKIISRSHYNNYSQEEQNLFEKDISKYDDIIKNLTNKYLLLLI